MLLSKEQCDILYNIIEANIESQQDDIVDYQTYNHAAWLIGMSIDSTLKLYRLSAGYGSKKCKTINYYYTISRSKQSAIKQIESICSLDVYDVVEMDDDSVLEILLQPDRYCVFFCSLAYWVFSINYVAEMREYVTDRRNKTDVEYVEQ